MAGHERGYEKQMKKDKVHKQLNRKWATTLAVSISSLSLFGVIWAEEPIYSIRHHPLLVSVKNNEPKVLLSAIYFPTHTPLWNISLPWWILLLWVWWRGRVYLFLVQTRLTPSHSSLCLITKCSTDVINPPKHSLSRFRVFDFLPSCQHQTHSFMLLSSI